MSWVADPQAFEQLKQILKGTLSPIKNERLSSTESLNQAKLTPDLDNYLLKILVLDHGSSPEIRASAGLVLKNNLKHFESRPDIVKGYIFDNLLNGLLDEHKTVRNITGNVITNLFSKVGIENWPQVLPNLIELANGVGGSIPSQEGAINALAKICEDSAPFLDVEYKGERPLNFMIPNFLQLTNSPLPIIRAQSIFCINQFIPIKSQSFLVHLDNFLERLFTLATDESDQVRQNVCSGFSLVLDARPDKITPHIEGVINYCLHSMQDRNSEVALEACEFLLGLATSSNDAVKPKLDLILPLLLAKMVYSEEDIYLMSIMDEKDDANIADRDEDIKPQNIKSRDAHIAQNTSTTNSSAARIRNDDDSDFESDYDSDDDSDDDMDITEWNLRKCSAATLDVLATNLPGEVLNITLPILQERIVSSDWPVREAAILAFGAISDGCLSLASDKLPSLVPFLVERLEDAEPRVRQITSWTLSRYSSWVCEEAHDGGQYANYLLPTFHAIMSCALDTKKVVQQAACSSLESFIDASDYDLISKLIEPLLQHFAKCFQRYQRKNLIVLFDTVQTFVEKVGSLISANEEYVNILLPPLLEKWQVLADDDPDLWSLLECMSSVAASLGESFAPYAVPIYLRGLKILTDCIKLDQQCQTDPLIDIPEKDFMVTSLDLIDGLIQGFESHSAELIEQHNSQVNLMEILLTCLDDSNDDVRQASYALLGDLSIFVLPTIVKPYMHQIMVSIGNEISNRNFESSAVCNNAAWALGEIALRLSQDEMKPYINNLLAVLIPLLSASDVQPTVLENVAITIGRIGINSPNELSQNIPSFLLAWSAHIRDIVANEEKETAFRGLCNVIASNPTGFGDNIQGKLSLGKFIESIGAYEEPTGELVNLFQNLLMGYRAMFGEEWKSQILTHVDPSIREAIAVKYNV